MAYEVIALCVTMTFVFLYDSLLVTAFNTVHLFLSSVVDIFFFSEYFFFLFLSVAWLIHYYLTLDLVLRPHGLLSSQAASPALQYSTGSTVSGGFSRFTATFI